MANNAKHPQITLLLTRPLRGSDAFWQALPTNLRSDLIPMISPLIRINPLDHTFLKVTDAVFTSANGPLFGPAGHGKTAYCVGAQTTRAATDAGWIAKHFGNTADELVGRLIEAPPSAPLTHLCGVHTRGDIAARLRAAGINADQIETYDQVAQSLSDQATALLRRETLVILPLFSPRTARQFANQHQGGANLHIIALSAAVASELNQTQAASLHICAQPTRNAMIQSVQNVAASLPLG